MLLFLLAQLLACTPDESEDTALDYACTGDLAPGEVVVLAEGMGGTEGVAFSPDGRLFVSTNTAVIELFADGTWREVASFDHAIGLAWWGTQLMVASFEVDTAGGGVFALDVDSGVSTVFATGISQANFLAVTPWNTLLVSDDYDTRIFEVQPNGSVAVWLEEIQSPNGMAFTPDDRTLFVASTFGNPAPIHAVPISGESPGAPVEAHSYGASQVPDGLAMGADGRPLVALAIAGRIDRIGSNGPEEVANGVPTVASLAYGEGAWDPCSLFATSLFGDAVYRVGVDVRGELPRRSSGRTRLR